MRVTTEITIGEDREFCKYLSAVGLAADATEAPPELDTFSLDDIRVLYGPRYVSDFDDLTSLEQREAIGALEDAYERVREAA
jgi:hypothetical protein